MQNIQIINILLDKNRTTNQKKTVGADALHPLYYNIQYPGYLEKTRDLGLKTHAWTVNEEADMKALAKAGIEAIITNYPDKARKIIQETGGTGNV